MSIDEVSYHKIFIQFPETTPDFDYGFHIASSKQLGNDYVVLVDKKKCYKHQIYCRDNTIKPDFLKSDIYMKFHNCHYWFRKCLYNNHIIISDYSGITIFNNKLKIIHHIDMPISCTDVPDVWGFQINDNILSYWSVNTVNHLVDEYNEKVKIQETELINDLPKSLSNKQFRKARNEIIKTTKKMSQYSDIFNIPEIYINKLMLDELFEFNLSISII